MLRSKIKAKKLANCDECAGEGTKVKKAKVGRISKSKHGNHNVESIASDADFSDDDVPVTDAQHSRLISEIRQLVSSDTGSSVQGKTDKTKRQLRSEPSLRVSEFKANLSNEKVSLRNLVGAVKDPPASLRKDLSSSVKLFNAEAKKAEVVLPKHQQDRVEREVLYYEAQKKISRWQSAVERLHASNQLSFPLNKASFRMVDAPTEKIKSKRPLEVAISNVLNGNLDVDERESLKLTEDEKKMLSAMNIAKARLETSQIRKFRAIMSQQLSKFKQRKKIKSKKYHRILKKERNRRKEKELDELKSSDISKYAEQLQQIDLERMRERMNLKHKNESKYAKRMKARARTDANIRQQLQEMHRKSKLLTRKVENELSSESDESAAEEDGDESYEVFFDEKSTSSNPWMQTPQQQFAAPSNKDDDNSQTAVEDVAKAAGKEGKMTKADEGRKITRKGNPSLSSGVKLSKRRSQVCGEVSNPTGKIGAHVVDQNSRDLTEDDSSCAGDETGDDTNENVDSDDGPEMVIRDIPENSLPIIHEDIKSSRVHSEMETLFRKGVESVAKIVEGKNVKLPKAITPKLLKSHSEIPLVHGKDRDAHVDDDDATVDQRKLIEEAFQDDDVVNEFEAEKLALQEKENPKDVCLFLPGWGSWGGTGIQVAEEKKARFTVKAPVIARADQLLQKVIISETVNRPAEALQVSKLPDKYLDWGQFNKAMKTPVGREWQPENAFQDMIVPKVTTKAGAIIEPMDQSVLLQPGGDEEEGNNEGKNKKKEWITMKKTPKRKLLVSSG